MNLPSIRNSYACVLVINEQPQELTTFEEAKTLPQREEWIAAMQAQYNSRMVNELDVEFGGTTYRQEDC